MGLQVKLLITVASLILLVGCANVPSKRIERVYNNDFTTLEIRSFWAVCQKSFLQKNPYTPPRVMIEYCDCYSDHVRRSYKSMKELNSLKSYEELTKSLITECNMKIQQEQGLIDPASI